MGNGGSIVGQGTIGVWAAVPHSGLENRRCKRWGISQSELSLSLWMENLGGKSSSVTCLNRLFYFSKHVTFVQSSLCIEACRMLLLSHLADEASEPSVSRPDLHRKATQVS